MTWMKHAVTGNVADVPDLPYWRGAGWDPTDERPPELDTLRDPLLGAEPESPETTEAPAEKTPGLPAVNPKKSAASAKTEES